MALLQRFSLIVLLFTLVACGGGEGGFGTTAPDPDKDPEKKDIYTINLVISEPNISNENPTTLSATVLKNGEAVKAEVVNFSINEEAQDSASFSPESGTSITDDNGVATMKLSAGGTAGAGKVTAQVTLFDAEVIISNPVSFDSAGDTNTGTTPDVSSIALFASSQQIASSGAQEITLSAIAKDDNNNLLEDVQVTFAATSGQIEVVKALTGADGKALATFKTANEPSNRIVKVTASTAKFSDSVDIQVVGTTVQLTGSSSLAINDSNNFIVRVLDSDGNGIAKTLVNLSTGGVLNSGNVATINIPESVTTDFTGQATVSVVGTTGGKNSLLANALGASANQVVNVQADSFLFSTFNDGNQTNVNLGTQSLTAIPDVLLSKTATITLTWLRNGVAVPDGTRVNFTATRGDLPQSFGLTSNGKVSTMLSSTNAGKSLVTFSGVDGSVALNNQLEFEFVAETAATIVAQASPHSIGPNGQKSTISIVVKDSTGNLVKNKLIDFTLTDTSSGSIFPASAVTDSNGTASTVYTSNTVSAQNSVSIKAIVRETPIVNDVVALTVADRELFISLGTGNEIEEIDTTNYNKKFSVFVTDVDSTPVKNVELTVSAVPKTYYKGFWTRIYDAAGTFLSWQTVGGVTTDTIPTEVSSPHQCINEDINTNGILDKSEDLNNNGLLDLNLNEDLDGDGRLDIAEDFNNNNVLDTNLNEDLNPNGILEVSLSEDFNRNGILDISINEDKNNDSILDEGEDLNRNGVLDTALNEDLNRNGVLDTSLNEDLNRNGRLDTNFSEDLDNDGRLDTKEDLNNNNILDTALNEDLNGNNVLDFFVTEDKNNNGILDFGEDLNENNQLDDYTDEDFNGDGALTPGNVVAALGNLITDDEGKAVIDIRYPQSYGSWVNIELIVSAKVTGTESTIRTVFTLSTLSSDILDEDISPPTSSIGLNGPFGAAQDCANSN